MDFTESTKVVYNRIHKVDPENVSKIIGYLLLKDHGEREMIRLAFGPDNLICSLINKAKCDLGLSQPAVSGPISSSVVSSLPISDVPRQFTPFSPASAPSSVASYGAAGTHWNAPVIGDQQLVHDLEFGSSGYLNSITDDCQLQNRMRFLTLDDESEFGSSGFSSSYFHFKPALGSQTNRRSPSLPDFPVKLCHYFNKGFCKHGNNCRFFHGHLLPETFSQIISPNSSDILTEERAPSPGSLEKLEMELAELLKSRRGTPVSIASLPIMYYNKYGKTLQAAGYLTESQRRGKAGYNLTKILARLKNRIFVIDRPHGQHSVILAEDVPKYLEFVNEKNDTGGIVAGSRQIYLTFPAESTFTEQDVYNYFSKIGPVQDVRIPCQQRRMFGFVTFMFVETVRQILTKGNPHFVCGARVLVKPYREKSRLIDRKFWEKMQHPMHYEPHFIEGDCKIQPMPRICDNSSLLRKQQMEEHDPAIEFEQRCLSEFQLPSNDHTSYFDYSIDELKLSKEHVEFPSMERFNYMLDVLSNGSCNRKNSSI